MKTVVFVMLCAVAALWYLHSNGAWEYKGGEKPREVSVMMRSSQPDVNDRTVYQGKVTAYFFVSNFIRVWLS